MECWSQNQALISRAGLVSQLSFYVKTNILHQNYIFLSRLNFVSKTEFQFQNFASILKLNFNFRIEVRFEKGALILKSTRGDILKLEFHCEL